MTLNSDIHNMNTRGVVSVPGFEYLNAFSGFNNLIIWYPRPGMKKDGTPKVDKVPCQIQTETFENIDHTNKAFHMDVVTAVSWCVYGREKFGVNFGVGLSLSAADPYIFLDFDKCVDYTPDGSAVWSQCVTDALQRFPGAFIETSYSGTGLHIIGSGTIDIDLKTRCKDFPGEIYSAGRFVALTGHQAQGSPLTSIDGVIQPYMQGFGWERREVTADASTVEYTDLADSRYTFEGDDDELLHAMQRSKGSNKTQFGQAIHVWDLFTDNQEEIAKYFPSETARDDGLPYDRSRACAALFGHLAYWTGRNTDRMQRLFKRSSLYDPEHHSKHGDRHIKLMLSVALQNDSGVYDVVKSGKSEKTEVDWVADGFLTVPEQVEHFAGCVYILELDRILTPDGMLLNQSQFNSSDYGGYVFQMQSDNQGGTTKKAWEAFTMNRSYRFPKANGTYFNPADPTGHIDRMKNVNVWIEPVIDTVEGDPTPFIDHIRKILPNGDDADILITWMQGAARYRDKKIAWSPVIQGAEGNGKTIIADILKNVTGDKYFHIARPEHIGKEQNGWLHNKRLVFVEEIHVNDRRELLDALKPMVSNKHVEIRDMGIKGTTRRNYANFMFFTNFKDAIPINVDSRRYCILYTAQQSRADMVRDGLYDPNGETSVYFTNFINWLENENGYEIINNYLLNAPIRNEIYDPVKSRHVAPKTSSTEEAYLESLTGVERDIIDAVNEYTELEYNGQKVPTQGAIGFRGGWIDTARIIELTGSKMNTRALNKTLIKLGYVKICRASYFTCGRVKGNLYFKGDISQFKGMTPAQITQEFKRVGNNEFNQILA